ncbi:hypothetical protein AB0M45_20785 [Nocardia sp. NPDC051787]|uniref:hypothetical protein n=1 Tax=Nocardia sp. NPDC051787 TaxID=3155415 RepID=UPI0034249A65
MITTKMRATAAAVAVAPVIALGSGFASAAPDVSPVPVDNSAVPVQVEPATLGLIWPLGIFCAPLLLLPPVINAVAVFVCAI